MLKYLLLSFHLITLLLFCSGKALGAGGDNVDLDINIESKKAKNNIEAYLSVIKKEELTDTLRFQSRIQDEVTEALKAVGFYHSVIDISINEAEKMISIDVEQGEQVHFDTIDIMIIGEGAEDEDFKALIVKAMELEGQPLDHSLYDSFKSSIRNLGIQKGYFNGEFLINQLNISPELNKAYIKLHYQSSRRYRFGHVAVDGSQIEEQRIRNIIPFEEGDPYDSNQIGNLNQLLSSTGWFSSIKVAPRLDALKQTEQLPIDISLAPQVRNQVETGIGYSTDVGVRGKLKWKKPWLNALGHSLDISFEVSRPEQSVTGIYKIPLEQVLTEYYQVVYRLENEDNNDTESLLSSLALERHWILDNGWHRTYSVRHLFEDFVQGVQDDQMGMVLLGISFSRAISSGGMMPRKGRKLALLAEVTDQFLGSDNRLLHIVGQSKWIYSLGEGNRFVNRLDVGVNIIDDIMDTPPSLRYFAGGDKSIRGYDYETISPRDSGGFLMGGKMYSSGTIEYQRHLLGNWWVAFFADAGDSWNGSIDLKVGTGVGILYASPIGPIRLDIASGLNNPDEDFMIHFSLGPEL